MTFTKVPYRDIVQAVNDLAEGRLQVYSSSYAIQRRRREAGRIKVLAQMGRKRAPSLPDIPTAAEAGFPAMEMEGLVGLFGSPAVSAELREKIGADIVAVADDKDIDAKLNATAQTPDARRGEGVRRDHGPPTRPDRHHRQGARSQADAVSELRQQQHRARDLAALDVAMRVRGVGQRIGAADLDLENSARHQVEQLGGGRAHRRQRRRSGCSSAGRQTESEPRLAS